MITEQGRTVSMPALLLLLSLPACSIFGGDDYGKARFILTPSGGGDAVTVTVKAKYHSPATGDCHLEIYDIDGENRYIQFSPFGIGSTCEGVFESTITANEVETVLNGTVLRTFGGNSGSPFASGTYFAQGGGFGTFVFYEDELPDL